jgi:type I restriction enzyme S subunit
MAIPDTEIMKFFNELISPVFKKIKNNTAQIQTLSKTRDTLLPKLMSGAIRVKRFGESQ